MPKSEYKTYFVDVILPLPVPGLFTYRVPNDLIDQVSEWKRVVVQFGKKKVYTAIVVHVHEKPPANTFAVKYILSVIDQQAVMTKTQYQFWQWIASYYMCELGEVMQVAIPSGLKLASESKIRMNPEFDGDFDSLPDKEYLIAEALDRQETLTLSEVESIVGQKTVILLVKSLFEKKVVLIEEELQEKYKPKKEKFIRLHAIYHQEEKLQELFSELEKRAHKQLEILVAFIAIIGGEDFNTEVNQKKILSRVENGSSALSALVKKGVFEVFENTVSRLEKAEASSSPKDIELTEKQQEALQQIQRGFEGEKTVLLHGVTSSGKTEIYIKLIEETLNQNKQVLYLLPEIALTTQIINRLRNYFGDKVGVYHSRYSENERTEVWNHVISDEQNNSNYKVILGPRSALYLPFQDLGLIIVDEEHDYSFKQFDPTPRYHARDAAIYLGRLQQSKILLGSATPSLESYYNARSGKYHLVELTERYGNVQLPEILVADVKTETRRKTMKSHFSSFLMEHIQQALNENEQVILFQNRRGFSLRLECETCQWVPECKNCDVTLTYHKHFNQLKCHYCGYTRRVPDRCDSCGSTHLKMKGFGTEKLEDDLAIFFPEKKIKRMDLDTTRSKHAYHNIITEFENRQIDILVGTQMVTKGLDFDNVSIVGIMNADNLISFPDFRSFERSFQLMAQVSGRAGRKQKRGKVIIQTYQPYHSVIRDVTDHNYLSMYHSQILERRNFKYPPFYRLIQIGLKHKDSRHLNESSRHLAEMLRDILGKRVYGPEYPLVSRIKNLYIKNILVKLERDDQLSKRKKEILRTLDNFRSEAGNKSIRIVIDVDPV